MERMLLEDEEEEFFSNSPVELGVSTSPEVKGCSETLADGV